jgi:hypothetical protein
MEIMARAPTAQALKLDPAGGASLSLAKRVRLDVLRHRLPRDSWRLTMLAEQRFGLPGYALPYWEQSGSERPWGRGNGTPDA